MSTTSLTSSLDKINVWPGNTGYRIEGSWLEPDVSVSWPGQRRDENYIDAKQKSMTVYARRDADVTRHVVDCAYRSQAAQATFTLAEIFAPGSPR